MSRIEYFILISFGFFLFIIGFIRIGFLIGSPISIFTFACSFLIYCISLMFILSTIKGKSSVRQNGYTGTASFILFMLLLSALTFPLGYTYDTSWDGQGYHQTAVIALASG